MPFNHRPATCAGAFRRTGVGGTLSIRGQHKLKAFTYSKYAEYLPFGDRRCPSLPSCAHSGFILLPNSVLFNRPLPRG